MKKIGLIFTLFLTALFLFGCGGDPKAEYEVIEELDREDSYNVKVATEQTSEKELKSIVEDVKTNYNGVDAVWLWVYDKNNDDLLAKAKIPYNDKGELMVGEKEITIEYE